MRTGTQTPPRLSSRLVVTRGRGGSTVRAWLSSRWHSEVRPSAVCE